MIPPSAQIPHAPAPVPEKAKPDPKADFRAEYDAYCAEHGVPERLELLLCDINAVLRGKWLPGDKPEKLTNGSVRLPLSTYAPNILGYEVGGTGFGIEFGDPDGALVPVPGTLCPVPWAEGNVAQVLVEIDSDDAGIYMLSPRTHLENVLDRFAAHGWRPVVATELEFYLIRKRAHPEEAPVPPIGTPEAQNYDMELLHRFEPVLKDIIAACAAQDLPTDTLIAEYGPGQFEVNFLHTPDALAAADMALKFRRLVRSVAARHGLEATFMAKPYADQPGNGMHAHVSVIDAEGRNIFDAGEAAEEASPLLRHAVAGTLSTMRDLEAIFAPHLNSLRRFGPGSFAPHAPEWGYDHRGAAIRIPDFTGPGARLEHRICGADVNPYLALAAILGGVLTGLEAGQEPPSQIDDAAHETPPPLATDWAESVETFAASAIAADIFGADYRHVYAQVRRDEIAALTTIISPAECRYYLSRL